MRKYQSRLKKRRGNKYPVKVILVASVVFWMMALILWFHIQFR
jgi:hypothetical protein